MMVFEILFMVYHNKHMTHQGGLRKLRDFCLQTNHTDRAAASCRRSFSANFLRIEGVAWSAQQIPTAVNFGFLKIISFILSFTPFVPLFPISP
jgi:hypothetical protein